MPHREPIRSASGQGAVVPTREAVEQAQYQPLSHPLFIDVNLQKSQENPGLSQFVTFYLDNVQQTAQAVGYMPLLDEAYEISKVPLYKGEVGTAYEGKPQPYLTINEVLQKEQAF